MSEEKPARKTEWIRQRNRRVIANITGAVLVVGSVVGVQAFAGSDTYQHMQLASEYKSHWHGHKRFSEMSDAEIEDRVERIVKHTAIEVDATPEQQQRIIALVTATAADLKPVTTRMRATGKEMKELLLATTVDRAALEMLHAERLSDAEKVSKDMVRTVADIADLLSPEQRKILEERVEQFRHMRRGWHRG